MCFFRKKKKEINTKYKMKDFVSFKYRGERCFGWIYEIHYKEGEETIYDIQIGGQCPAILYNFKESQLTKIEKK